MQESEKIIPALKAFILLFGDILFGLGVVVAGWTDSESDSMSTEDSLAAALLFLFFLVANLVLATLLISSISDPRSMEDSMILLIILALAVTDFHTGVATCNLNSSWPVQLTFDCHFKKRWVSENKVVKTPRKH